MVSPRAARREAQVQIGREQVLAAAEQVFGDKGYHDASIKEIAEASEFSVGSVYGFFENKDDLFIQVMERRGGELVGEMGRLFSGGGSPVENLHALADLQVGFFRRHPSFGRLFVGTTGAPLINLKASVEEETRGHYEEAMALQAGLFESGQAEGTLVEGSLAILSEIFSGIVLAFQSHDPETVGRTSDEPLDLSQLHALLERTFVVGGTGP